MQPPSPSWILTHSLPFASFQALVPNNRWKRKWNSDGASVTLVGCSKERFASRSSVKVEPMVRRKLDYEFFTSFVSSPIAPKRRHARCTQQWQLKRLRGWGASPVVRVLAGQVWCGGRNRGCWEAGAEGAGSDSAAHPPLFSSGGLAPRYHRVNAAPAAVCALTSLFIFLNFSFLILTMLLIILVTLQVNCEESMNNACEGLCEGSGTIQKSACRSFCFSEMAFCWFRWFELFPCCFVPNLQEWKSCLCPDLPQVGEAEDRRGIQVSCTWEGHPQRTARGCPFWAGWGLRWNPIKVISPVCSRQQHCVGIPLKVFWTQVFQSEKWGICVGDCCCCLVAQLCLTLCNSVDCSPQAPLSMGFYRQEYWSGLPFPSPGDLPDPGLKPGPPALQADSLPSEPLGKPSQEIRWTNSGKKLNTVSQA